MKRIIVVIIILGITYYFGSVFFSKNNQFIQYNSIVNLSIEESKLNNQLILDNCEKYIELDNLNFIEENFTIWLDLNIYKVQFGLLPLSINKNDKENYILNIRFKNDDLKNVFIVVNDEPKVLLANGFTKFLKYGYENKIYLYQKESLVGVLAVNLPKP